jgi:DNA invertase Pin-like site-specific DNA recombinase
MSIQHQKDILVAYCTEHGYKIADIYADDGYTGTNFERPEFKRMIKDIELGRINMVITKDLSRLGRNYVKTGHYLDYVFPDYGVRYIAVNDNYDNSLEDDDVTPFKNILNEMYAKDISKKVRSAGRVAASQGKFLGSNPPYGYMRSEDDKHCFIIDDPAAMVVRRIFQAYIADHSTRRITGVLNSEGILSPKDYYDFSHGHEIDKVNPRKWNSATVIAMLRREAYIGKIVQNKVGVKSFKTKERKNNPPEMWTVVDNTHEPIIDQATWSETQELLKSSKYSRPKTISNSGEYSLFSGVLRCRDCGAGMCFSSRELKRGTDYYYRCSQNVHNGKCSCSPHRINLDTLSEVVLTDIKKTAQLAEEDEEKFLKNLHKINLEERDKNIKQSEHRIKELEKRLTEITNFIKCSFEKNCNRIISDDMFKSMVSGYTDEELSIKTELSNLRNSVEQLKSRKKDITKDMENLKKYIEIKELDRKIVTSLIQSIHISEPEKVNDIKKYDIEIRYKFQNPYLAKVE